MLHMSVKIFFGRGTRQDVYREWLTTRFAAVQTLNPENPTPTPYRHGADPKDTARRLLLARQRLPESASCSCEKPLLAERGTLQGLYGYINSRMVIPAPGP